MSIEEIITFIDIPPLSNEHYTNYMVKGIMEIANWLYNNIHDKSHILILNRKLNTLDQLQSFWK